MSLRLSVFSTFIFFILIEIYLLIQVGSLIGGLETLALIILSAILGIHILRNPRLISVQRIMEQMQERPDGNFIIQKPILFSEPFIESFLVIFGGFFLIMPGILSDFLGLIAIFPYTRLFLVKRLNKYFTPVAANDGFIEADYRREDK
jgi:UPF0716 protein FxsA